MARLKGLLSGLPAIALLAWPALCVATEPGQAECTATGAEIAGLMEKTKLNAIMNYEGLDSEFTSDGDPETLELVFLPKKKGAVSHVSDDGEVIFLHGNVRDKEQQRLITMAFCLRAVARRGLTPRSSGRVIDKVPSSNVGVRAAQLNR